MGALVAVGAAVRHDLHTLLTGWRGLLFDRHRRSHPVAGRWRPTTPGRRLAFWAWTAVGVPLIAVVYPLAVLGFATRVIARRLDWAAGAIGVLAVIAGLALVWGGLTVVAWVRFPTSGFLAVLAASIVATVSAALAWEASRVDGRPVTVLVAYPFAIAAIFLPPVTAALVAPSLGELILPGSESLAVWLLENPLAVGGVDEFLRREFTLANLGYIGMWFGLAVPVGWFLGGLVTLANAIRPTPESTPV